MALYVGLSTDTGNFRYSNTDDSAHTMAAELLAAGVDPHDMYLRVHAVMPAERLRFFGEVLATLEMHEQGRLAVVEATPEQFQRHGLSGADTEGLVDLPRIDRGGRGGGAVLRGDPGAGEGVAALDGTRADRPVCARFGGGGHPHAAGAMMSGSRAEVRARVLPEIARLLAAAPRVSAATLTVHALRHRYGLRTVATAAWTGAFEGPAVVAVTGANGAGKSTLLRILAGLLRPERGAGHPGRRGSPGHGRRAQATRGPRLAQSWRSTRNSRRVRTCDSPPGPAGSSPPCGPQTRRSNRWGSGSVRTTASVGTPRA